MLKKVIIRVRGYKIILFTSRDTARNENGELEIKAFINISDKLESI